MIRDVSGKAGLVTTFSNFTPKASNNDDVSMIVEDNNKFITIVGDDHDIATMACDDDTLR